MNPYHDERGRFTFASMAARVQIKRTLAHVRSASDDELAETFLRITMRARRGKTDEAALAALDAELQRRVAGGEPEPTPEQLRVDELLAGGASFEEAYREAYGPGDREDTSGRRAGESREELRRRQYAEATYLTFLEAEQQTRGHLLNRAGRAAGVDPRSLFSGQRSRAVKYASDELIEFWSKHPRRTYAEYRAELLGDTTKARRARSARTQSGNGAD